MHSVIGVLLFTQVNTRGRSGEHKVRLVSHEH